LADVFPSPALENWDTGFRLALGNELTGDRPWLGQVTRAEVRVAGTSYDYLARGELAFPTHLRRFHHPPRLIPVREAEPIDSLVNLLGFVPLGLALALLWGGTAASRPQPPRRWLALLFAMSLLSLGLELGQWLMPSRYMSIDDLILNTLGGGLGLLLGWRILPLFGSAASLFGKRTS
jgi:VanZ family protein